MIKQAKIGTTMAAIKAAPTRAPRAPRAVAMAVLQVETGTVPGNADAVPAAHAASPEVQVHDGVSLFETATHVAEYVDDMHDPPKVLPSQQHGYCVGVA